jgi:hypothetical protein
MLDNWPAYFSPVFNVKFLALQYPLTLVKIFLNFLFVSDRVRGRCFATRSRETEKSRCRNDAEKPLAVRSRRGVYGDLNVSAKQGQEMAFEVSFRLQIGQSRDHLIEAETGSTQQCVSI